ncbi:MAG: DedA family protein [Methylococcaceae bacterium]|nr:DedA family protein [Methylococcaceae bacterium]
MQNQLLGLTGLFTSAFVSSTLLPGGSEAVLAYMVATGDHSPAKLVTIAAVGNTLGALTTWGLGMLAAKKFPAEHLLSGKKQQALAWVRKYGHWSLLFSWLPIIGDGFCFAGGWLKLAFLPAFLAILVGKTVRYAVVAVLFVPWSSV